MSIVLGCLIGAVLVWYNVLWQLARHPHRDVHHYPRRLLMFGSLVVVGVVWEVYWVYHQPLP